MSTSDQFPPSNPLRILSAGTTVDDSGISYPTLVVDVKGRPDVEEFSHVAARDGVGDLRTVADVGLDPRGRSVIRLRVTASNPMEIEFSLLFPLPAYSELLSDAARMGCLVIAGARSEESVPASGDWIGINVDGESLARLISFAG